MTSGPTSGPVGTPGLAGDGWSARPLLDGTGDRLGVRPDPDRPGWVQLRLVSDAGVVLGSRTVPRQALVSLVQYVTSVGGIRQTSPVIDRSPKANALAGAMRLNLSLIRKLHEEDPLAAEALIRALVDDLRSWLPALTSGVLGY